MRLLAGAVMWTLLSSVQWKFTATTAETAGAYNYPGKRITVSFCLNEMNKEAVFLQEEVWALAL